MQEGTSWSERVLERQEAPAELVERARHDREAFGEIFDFYVARVFAFCRLHSANRQEAEPLTAQTFEWALSALGRYESRGALFSGWLLRIASSAITDRGRKSSRLPELFRRAAPREEEDRVRQWEHAYRLRSHLGTLPDEQQEVARLRFYDDQPFMAVAASMGRTEPAVRQLLRRALRSLLVQMEEERALDVN
jgi:RNA polymerase sigma-70 factor (ECF subfamily)